MGHEVISGIVSHASQGAGVSHIPVGGSSIRVQKQIYSFRLDGREVTFLTDRFPSVADGDRVAVVGQQEKGTFKAVALRNLTTGSESYPAVGCWGFVGWGMVVTGVLYYIADLAFRWPFVRTPSTECMLWVGVGGWIASRTVSTTGAYRKLRAASFD